MFDSSTIFWLVIAALGGLCVAGIWLVFLRPVPRQGAAGVITQKTFKPASTRWIAPVGQRTNFGTPTSMPVTEAYIFTIRTDDRNADAIVSLNTTASERFAVGQRVSIDYEERGFGSLWRRVYVLNMRPE